MSTRTRRHRRQFKQLLKYGPSAKPTHKSRGGRTGRVYSRSTKPKKSERTVTRVVAKPAVPKLGGFVNYSGEQSSLNDAPTVDDRDGLDVDDA